MPISGLVVVLDSSLESWLDSLEQLRRHPAIDVGEISDGRVAIVVDSNSREHDQEVWHWVQELPGVLDIRIAFIGFDDDTSSDAPSHHHL